MHVCKWKRKHPYPYNPNKPKIMGFAASASASQPHRTWKFEIDSHENITFSGCSCIACETYYRLIARINPKRFSEMVLPREQFIRRMSAEKMLLAAENYIRRNRGTSKPRWRG